MKEKGTKEFLKNYENCLALAGLLLEFDKTRFVLQYSKRDEFNSDKVIRFRSYLNFVLLNQANLISLTVNSFEPKESMKLTTNLARALKEKIFEFDNEVEEQAAEGYNEFYTGRLFVSILLAAAHFDKKTE